MMDGRLYNFSAGPAMLPTAIMQEVRDELLNWQGHGVSIMELGHRTAAIVDMMAETQALFQSVLSIPPNYHVLFLGGAARSHFASIPMNFLRRGQVASFLVTGIWSKLAFEECRRIARAEWVINNENNGFTHIPVIEPHRIDPQAAYLYYTSNETINGVQFTSVPEHGNLPLVCDMTSSLLSEPVDISRYGLIFAGAQKNIANAGLTVVIVADSFIEKIEDADKVLPTMLDYRTHIKNRSLYATPPVFNCYLANKMLRWVQRQGGVEAMQTVNQRKAARLYEYIDNSQLYRCDVDVACRSVMNVCFQLVKKDREQTFVRQAEASGLLGLQGHRTAGGIRASLYNAMPESGVDALLAFMQRFEKDNT